MMIMMMRRMKRIKRYVAAAVLAVLMTAGLSSCVYDYATEDAPSNQPEDGDITLFIRLGILDGPASRAEAPDKECIHAIRIVMLDLDNGGKVEYNKRISYEINPVINTGFILIPTIKGEKKIFFIANEESVKLVNAEEEEEDSLASLLDRFPEGTDGFEEAINSAYFKLDTSQALPMTSEYKLTAGQPGENNYTFYVVPVATKYTFNITNKRVETASTITRIAIEDLADANYVMPHVQQQYRDWKEADGSITSLYWIDWLKNVVDATNSQGTVSGNYNENQSRGWILDYELPEHSDAPHDMFVGEVSINGVPSNKGDEEIEYEKATFGPYYAPESKTLKSASNPNGAQTYTLVLELTDGTGEQIQLTRELSFFVTALFRNTHVVMDITIEMGYMHIYGEIRSWKENDVYGSLTEED